MNEPWVFIEQTRKERRMSQADVCRDLCAQSQYSLFEQGVLIPDDELMDRLLDRLDIADKSIGSVWRVHRQFVRAQMFLWRAFVKDRFDLVHDQIENRPHEQLPLETMCYLAWADTYRSWRMSNLDANLATILIDPLATHHFELIRNSRYIPRQMRSHGDLRLRIVLAMTESMRLQLAKRYSSSFVWTLRAQDLFLQIPRYWV